MARIPNSFYRSQAMQMAIANILAAGGGQLNIQMAVQALGEYRSHGKSGRHSKPNRNYLRNSGSKYQPHQGFQEAFRRYIGGWAKSAVRKPAALADLHMTGEFRGTAR